MSYVLDSGDALRIVIIGVVILLALGTALAWAPAFRFDPMIIPARLFLAVSFVTIAADARGVGLVLGAGLALLSVLLWWRTQAEPEIPRPQLLGVFIAALVTAAVVIAALNGWFWFGRIPDAAATAVALAIGVVGALGTLAVADRARIRERDAIRRRFRPVQINPLLVLDEDEPVAEQSVEIPRPRRPGDIAAHEPPTAHTTAEPDYPPDADPAEAEPQPATSPDTEDAAPAQGEDAEPEDTGPAAGSDTSEHDDSEPARDTENRPDTDDPTSDGANVPDQPAAPPQPRSNGTTKTIASANRTTSSKAAGSAAKQSASTTKSAKKATSKAGSNGKTTKTTAAANRSSSDNTKNGASAADDASRENDTSKARSSATANGGSSNNGEGSNDKSSAPQKASSGAPKGGRAAT